MSARMLFLVCALLCLCLGAAQPMDSEDMLALQLEHMDNSHDIQEFPHGGSEQLGTMESQDAMADRESMSAEDEELMEILASHLPKWRKDRLRMRLPRSGRGMAEDKKMLQALKWMMKVRLLRLKFKLKLLRALKALCAADMGTRIVYRGMIVSPRALERHFLLTVLNHKLLLKMLVNMRMRGRLAASPLGLKLSEMQSKVGKALVLYAPNKQSTDLHLHADRAIVNVGTTLARTRASTVDDRVTLKTAAVEDRQEPSNLQRPSLRDAIHELPIRGNGAHRMCYTIRGRLLCPHHPPIHHEQQASPQNIPAVHEADMSDTHSHILHPLPMHHAMLHEEEQQN